jgi:hypothetical protein
MGRKPKIQVVAQFYFFPLPNYFHCYSWHQKYFNDGRKMVELELGLFLPQKSKLELGSSRAPSTKKKNKKQERKKEKEKGIARKIERKKQENIP